MVMKYIIMCGGNYKTYWETPRQLMKIKDEVLVERTIRQLKENGITDISISTNNKEFDYLGVPILKHENSYRTEGKELLGYWCDAFYLTDEPTCYIFGDVYFSDEAIKTIINTDTDDIEFFASMPPFAINYPKNHVEPFALKVVDTDHLKSAIQKTKQLEDEGKFWRKAIMWELWTVIKDVPLQKGPDDYIYNYVAINDYTSDIDRQQDIAKLEKYIEGGLKMVKVKVVREFTLGRFDELKNLVRNNPDRNEDGRLYEKDEFECNQIMADYLTGENKYKQEFVKILEVIPEEPKVEEKAEVHEEVKPKATVKKTKKSKKK